MANGYFRMSVGMVNKGTQSAVSMASYRSGEKLYSLRDGETKNYKERFVKADNFILKPDNAPEWTLEREKLWNEVESYEERDNAQIARSVLLSLPNDLNNEQQLELTQEFIQDNFVDDGMVADVSIHRDDVNNPHAHVLLTTRPFDEQGNWEERKSKRVPVLDEKGEQTYNEKGWRNTRSVKLTDWDNTATLNKWRENWSEKLNEKAIKFETQKEYSHKSFEKQGKLEKAEIPLTRNEYQFEQRLKNEAEKSNEEYKPVTYYAKQNAEIKEYNEQFNDIIHLEDYKQKKDYNKYLNDLRYNVHRDETKKDATRLLVDRAKGYVDYKVSKNLYNDFNNERNKWKLKLERATSLNNSKKELYNSLIKQHKDNPSIVERYGYSIDNFKEEMKEDILNVQSEEQIVSAEYEKFNELKQATITSYDYQKELIDMEFSSIYSDIDTEKHSYDEKYFAMQLLKDKKVMLPVDMIKDEFISQDKNKALNNKYIPMWKQTKDTLTSIDIYNRTINKIERTDTNKIAPAELKDSIIKLNSIKTMKNDYENYLEEVSPMIDSQIENISDNKVLNNSDIHIKVAFLEKYSSLNEEERENINMNEFVEELKDEYEQQAEQFNNHSQDQEQDEDRKNIYQESAKKSEEIASGLFSVLQSLSQQQNLSQDKGNKDRTKVARKRGTDGREL